MIFRILGIILIVDATGSICLRHKDLKAYINSRQVLEISFRLVRLAIGVMLVMLG